jgi:peptidoglycan/LPS O-acetylase OafA/YrhL
MNREIKSLTGLRGIVALWVVLFHFYTELNIGFLQRTIGQGYLAVDIFFVLSAFLLTVSYSEKFRNLNVKGIVSFYKSGSTEFIPFILYLLSSSFY